MAGSPAAVERGQPDPAPEVAVMQRHPARAGEDQRLVARLGEARQVPADDRDDQRRELARPRLPALGLGRAEREAAAADLGELSSHPHGAGLQVDIAAPQRAQLTPPQAAEHRQQHECAVTLVDASASA